MIINAEKFAELTGSSVEQALFRLARYHNTFDSMQPWIATLTVKSFLDIGCGLGGVAAHVARYFPRADIHLLDGDALGVRAVYSDKTVPWADVNVAVKVVRAINPQRRIFGWRPSDVEKIPPCNFIYSNCSWGHHYSIETYLQLVSSLLAKDGVLIVDLRKGGIGIQGSVLLSSRFKKVFEMDDGKKYIRTIWTTL